MYNAPCMHMIQGQHNLVDHRAHFFLSQPILLVLVHPRQHVKQVPS